MEAPKTYTGKDKEGNVIATQTGKDANSYIDPAKVQEAINNVKSVAQQECETISSQLKGLIPDVESAISVKGKTMGGSVERICESATKVPAGIEGIIGDLYDRSVKVHDEKQKEWNEQARSAVAGTAGVVSVSES